MIKILILIIQFSDITLNIDHRIHIYFSQYLVNELLNLFNFFFNFFNIYKNLNLYNIYMYMQR